MKRSGAKIGLLAAALLLAATMSGCANQSQPRTQQTPNPANRADPTNPQAQGNTGNADNITEGTGDIRQDADQSNSAENNAKPREAQHIANALTGKYNIQNAYVFVTNTTAYVACVVHGQPGTMTEDVKNQVATEVRRIDPSIQRTYVSENPDVMNQFRNFGSQLRSGNPVQGVTSQFSDMVRRIWPEAK